MDEFDFAIWFEDDASGQEKHDFDVNLHMNARKGLAALPYKAVSGGISQKSDPLTTLQSIPWSS
jgi:hypothetical protein